MLSEYIFILSIIAPMVFFINFVAILKKIKEGKDTSSNTFWGAILIGFIMYCLIALR